MSSAKNSDLPLRLASAIVLGTAVLVITWYGGIYFRILMAMAAVLIYREWSTITKINQPVALVSAGWILVVFAAVVTIIGDPQQAMLFGGMVAAVLAVWGMVASGKIWVAGGVVYAVFPAASLVLVREAPSGFLLILLIFVIVWGTDIGAYFAGRTIGGPKLMPSVSPKKTWSGFFGGLVTAIAGTLIFLQFSGPFNLAPSGLVVAVLIAGILSVMSQLGDLFESWIKRLFGVKDSGELIPGHGGIMDRVDGLVVVAVAFYGLMATGLV